MLKTIKIIPKLIICSIFIISCATRSHKKFKENYLIKILERLNNTIDGYYNNIPENKNIEDFEKISNNIKNTCNQIKIYMNINKMDHGTEHHFLIKNCLQKINIQYHNNNNNKDIIRYKYAQDKYNFMLNIQNTIIKIGELKPKGIVENYLINTLKNLTIKLKQYYKNNLHDNVIQNDKKEKFDIKDFCIKIMKYLNTKGYNDSDPWGKAIINCCDDIRLQPKCKVPDIYGYD